MNSLTIIECVDFRIEDFPGYSNKRGAGLRCDEPFPLGKSSTFKLIVSPTAAKISEAGRHHQNSAAGRSQNLQIIPMHNRQNQQLPLSSSAFHGGIPLHHEMNTRNECNRIFGEYLNHAMQTFGRTDFDLVRSVHEALALGFLRYMATDHGRSPSGYINILEELHKFTILRRQWLQSMLSNL